jgi:hypothetical protein
MSKLQKIKFGLSVFSVLAVFNTMIANVPEGFKRGYKQTGSTPLSTRAADCVQGSSRFDMDVNNVRATLLGHGDVWWDLSQGRYIVPKVEKGTGAKEVSSIYAGAVWLGGRDISGNLKVACQTYRNGTKTDFWPGPLKEGVGTTDKQTCDNWDKHFVVISKDIDSTIKLYRAAKAVGGQVDCGLVPESLKGWPAQGNPYFFDVNRFVLPKTKQGLARFHDEDGDTNYDPCKGDYPIIEVDGCKDITAVPDQMIFWIYNDNGGPHTQSEKSTAIQMEVQVQAFAYQTTDELNDMTFQRYKLINRAVTDIDSTYFAMWVDPDLGCYTDDYVGCDTSRNLMYVYNQDAVDGTTGAVCDQGQNTYGDKVPILGVDYFRGPKNEFNKEIGMSAFTYYLGQGTCSPLAGMTDPNTAVEYYNYLTGRWRDGTPFTIGGSAYEPGSRRFLKYAFPDAPNNNNGWSMCTASLPCGDRRTIQASGPFKLKPGAVNELIIGVPWVADQPYPCPDIRRLQEADDIAQALFDNCFKIFDGPDAPDVNFVELDREIVAVLTNAPESNNVNEVYTEKGLKIPAGNPDSLYRFQGYKIYQLKDANVGDLEDVSKARLIGQVDLRDSIGEIFNWTRVEDPNFKGRNVYVPEMKVKAENNGIRHTFKITEDKFSKTDDKKLVNHKKYYFVAVAYGYNNYEKFDEKREKGQREPYVIGRRNRGDKNRGNKPYEVIPRPITDVKLLSGYGDGPVITRLDGIGTGTNFLDISDETRDKIISRSFDGTIVYKPGRGPIAIKIYNPLEVVDGIYNLSYKDSNQADDILDKKARWELKNLSTNKIVASDRTIDQLNEQIIAEFGFSVTIGQVEDAGTIPTGDKTNGAIGSEVVYADNTKPWLTATQDDAFGLANFNYIKNGLNEVDFNLDPKQSLSKVSDIFKPYYLCDYVYRSPANSEIPTFSPAWQNVNAGSVRSTNTNGLYNLNNVDIVLTKDKSKWSRCVVVETTNPYFYDEAEGKALGLTTEGNATMFDARKKASVGKDADANGLPKPDGDGTGMGWFPGYAIDVESGKRLNIFFGEATIFDPDIGTYLPESKGANRDMMWNPTQQVGLQTQFPNLAYSAFLGGQQFVYVTNTEYDSCKTYRTGFAGQSFRKPAPLRTITWASMPYLLPNAKMLPYKDGLIPNDAIIKLRVNNPYATTKGKGTNGNHPAYSFELKSKQSIAQTAAGVDSSLNLINIVPNPYYGYSTYEVTEFTTTVQFTNLPNKSTITIYTLDGRFIRQFKRDERGTPVPPASLQGIRTKQPLDFTEWDLKNEKGIPVASGVYLIHVDSPLGSRTLKFFLINRAFDPSKL